MNLKRDHWTLDDFTSFRSMLDSMREEKYRLFILKLIPNLNDCRGIRSPMMQKIIKEIGSGNWQEFLAIDPVTYEEKIIVVCLLGKIQDFDELLVRVTQFLPKIDNWAVCDTLAGSLHLFNANLAQGYQYIETLLASPEPYHIRLGAVLLLCYYCVEPYINPIIERLPTLIHEDYYVNMGIAWLISKLYIANPDATKVLFDGRLGKFVHLKAISKIVDSYQVSAEDKELVKTYRKLKK
jgi:3-methyladenine DNA glycosylase AlkD